MHAHSTGFIIGMVLLLTNQVVGWAGIGFGAYFGKKTGKKMFYTLGGGVYIFSWGMVALGAYLVGTEGIELAKTIMKTYGAMTLAALCLIAAGAAYHFVIKRKKTNAAV